MDAYSLLTNALHQPGADCAAANARSSATADLQKRRAIFQRLRTSAVADMVIYRETELISEEQISSSFFVDTAESVRAATSSSTPLPLPSK